MKRRKVEKLIAEAVAMALAERKAAARRPRAAKKTDQPSLPMAMPVSAAAKPEAAAAPKKPTRISEDVVASARRQKPKSSAGTPPPISSGIELFKPYQPPKFATGGKAMAMDTAIKVVGEWAGGWNGWGAYSQGYSFQGYQELALLAQIPEYRRISEVIATEMTRKWIKLQSTSEDEGKEKRLKELETELDRLKAQDMFRKCAEVDGFFGRSHLYLDTGKSTDRDELKTPLGDGRNDVTKAKFKKGDLKRLQVVEPVWCYPSSYNSDDPLSPNWYRPEMWFVMGKELHVSRLLCFIGREVPDLIKPAFSFGGLSLSQMAKPYVDNWLRTRQSVADIIHAFSVMVLSTDLQTSLQADGDQLFKRIDLFNALRDNKGVMMLNKESEEFKNVSAPLGTLDALQAQTQEHMAAVSGIPIVKLLGIQPAGLNASSEGEIRTFYDWIHAFQEKLFASNLRKVIDFAMMNIWGEIDEDISFAFEPLWSLDEKTVADMRKVEADTLCELIDHSLIDPEEGRAVLAANPDSPFAGLDVDDVPIATAPEEENIHERVDDDEDGGEGSASPQELKAA